MVKNQSSTRSNILWSSCCGQFHPSNTQITECSQFLFPNVGISMCSASFIGGWVFWEPSWKWVVLPLPDTHCNCWHRHTSCKLWATRAKQFQSIVFGLMFSVWEIEKVGTNHFYVCSREKLFTTLYVFQKSNTLLLLSFHSKLEICCPTAISAGIWLLTCCLSFQKLVVMLLTYTTGGSWTSFQYFQLWHCFDLSTVHFSL